MQPNLLVIRVTQTSRFGAKVFGMRHQVMATHIVQHPTPRLPATHVTGHTLATHHHGDLEAGALRHRRDQVSFEILILGNLLEKSLAFAAIFTATWRATAL